MTEVANYLKHISADLEVVCKRIMPTGFMVPKFSAQNFSACDNEKALTTIMQDFLTMEREALGLDTTYSIKLSLVKTVFLADWYATTHSVNADSDGMIVELMDCVTVDDMMTATN